MRSDIYFIHRPDEPVEVNRHDDGVGVWYTLGLGETGNRVTIFITREQLLDVEGKHFAADLEALYEPIERVL